MEGDSADDDVQRRERYPAECPSCGQPSANPKMAATVKGQPDVIRLHMLCGNCAHEWVHEKISEKPEP